MGHVCDKIVNVTAANPSGQRQHKSMGKYYTRYTPNISLSVSKTMHPHRSVLFESLQQIFFGQKTEEHSVSSGS
jgi:hypothetical protein